MYSQDFTLRTALSGRVARCQPEPPLRDFECNLLPTMKRATKLRRFVLFAFGFLFTAMQPAFPVQPRWANKATAFPNLCYSDKAAACKPLHIPAPDGKSSVEVLYRKDLSSLADDWWLQAYLRVTAPGTSAREAALPDNFEGATNAEILWSPDSRGFFVNGSDSAITGSMYVYLADEPTQPKDITEEAQRDMLKEFPPCKAAFPNAHDAKGCKKASRYQVPGCEYGKPDPKYTAESYMVGIDWVNASTILVMAEIPCDTLFGGIMCQVMGYELEVPSGRILKRIDAKHLKLDWQKSIAWKFRMPEPPLYCE